MFLFSEEKIQRDIAVHIVLNVKKDANLFSFNLMNTFAVFALLYIVNASCELHF